MRSTSGSRTCCIMARIRERRARASRSVWARSTSSIWRPTGTTGLSAVIGSWKIIAMVVARNCLRRRSLALSSSSPTSLMLPPDGTSDPFCNSPISASEVTDLPDPLSPTTHSVSPSRTCNDTPSMIRVACGFLPRPTTSLSMSRTIVLVTDASEASSSKAVDCFVDAGPRHLPPSRCFMRGSSASRAASPIRLTLRIAIDSINPGQKISDGLIWK